MIWITKTISYQNGKIGAGVIIPCGKGITPKKLKIR